jgi:hypothetical protein
VTFLLEVAANRMMNITKDTKHTKYTSSRVRFITIGFLVSGTAKIEKLY